MGGAAMGAKQAGTNAGCWPPAMPLLSGHAPTEPFAAGRCRRAIGAPSLSLPLLLAEASGSFLAGLVAARAMIGSSSLEESLIPASPWLQWALR